MVVRVRRLSVLRCGISLEADERLFRFRFEFRDIVRSVFRDNHVAAGENFKPEHAFFGTRAVKEFFRARFRVDAIDVSVGVVDPIAVFHRAVDVSAILLLPENLAGRIHEIRPAASRNEKVLRHVARHLRSERDARKKD